MNIFDIKMKKKTFFKHSEFIVASNIKIIDNYIYFKTDINTKKYLDQEKVNYKLESNLKSKVRNAVLLNFTLFTSILIFILCIYMNSFRVVDIKFNGNYLINEDIKNYIKSKYTHFLFWDFIDLDYEKLSDELRRKYPSYEWINAYKDGNDIIVNINNINDKINNEEYLKTGNIIAKKDAHISSFKVYSGISSLDKYDYVKKGDVLISGKINDTSFVQARGEILGISYEEINISWPKEEELLKEGEDSYKYHQISLFGKYFSVGKKNKYESYNTNRKLKFNLFNLFKVYEIEEIKLYDIINTYNKEEAFFNSKNEIINNFNKTKTLSDEEIMDIELLYESEDDDQYNFRFLVKKLESIGIFESF